MTDPSHAHPSRDAADLSESGPGPYSFAHAQQGHEAAVQASPDPSGAAIKGYEIFEILVREHTDMLTAYLRSLLGADPSVDDIFQQSMLVAWRRLADYDRSRPFGPWLRGIAQRLVLEHHRRAAGRARTFDPQVLAELDRRFDQLAAQPGDTFRERAERLSNCLSKLPDAMRHAIEMVYARGLLIAAAASALDSSEEAVKKRVQRARQLLAECLLAGS